MKNDGHAKTIRKTVKTREDNKLPTKTLIQKEEEASMKYLLKDFASKVTGDTLVKLSGDNAAKAEAIMRMMYSSSTSLNKKTENSTKSISELKKILFDKPFDKQEYRRIIAEIVARIDSENSTHLNTDGVGREELTNRILKISHDKLLDYLKSPKETKYELIRILEKKTHPRDMKHVGRINTSFASKFCHYMCIHLFEGTTYQDNYPIYDSIVRIVLPKYLKHYGIERSITDHRQLMR